MMLFPKNLKPHFPAGEMGLKFTEYSVRRSAKFDADTEWIIGAVIVAGFLAPFDDSTVLTGAGFKRRVIEAEFNPGPGPESKFSDKEHALAAHIVYFAIRKRPSLFVLQ